MKKIIALIVMFFMLTTACFADSLRGIDIYHGDSENNQINWTSLKSQIDFIYIKCDEGENYIDPMFTENVKNAKAQNIPFGEYHFIRFNSNPISQADNFYERIKNTGYSLIPAVDFESMDVPNITSAELRQKLREFITEFQKVSGITPIIYCSTSWANDYLQGYFTDCKLWLADYRGYAGSTQWSKWSAWQYTDRGNIPAIQNNEIDMDYGTTDIFLNSPPTTNNQPAITYTYNQNDYYPISSLSHSINSKAGKAFQIKDSNGNAIIGHSVSKNDPLVIMSCDYNNQLLEIEYPVYSENGWYHGYIDNDENYLHNIGFDKWVNGSTNETVYNAIGNEIGTIFSREKATKLYTVNGMTYVLYSTGKGAETKSGFVQYVGK